MILKLVVTTNANGDVFELLLRDAKYGVGRRHDNDLRIKETYVSGYHAELLRDSDGNYQVKDLDSSNGTFLNGDPVTTPTTIKAGDFIKFGILKVAVKEHTEGDGKPKIVSLKDRPAFAKQRNDQTTSIPGNVKTGEIAPESSDSNDPVSGPGNPEANEEAERTITELREILENKDAENSRLNEKLAAATESETLLSEKVDSLETELSSRDIEVATFKKTTSEKEDASRELEKTIEQLQSDLAASEAESEKTSSELNSLKSDLNSATSQLEESKARSREWEEQSATLEAELNDARSSSEKKLAELESLLKEKESQLSDQQEKAQSLENDLRSKDSKLSDASAQAAELLALGATIKTLESALSDSNAESEKASVEKEGLESKLEESSSELAARSAELEALKQSLDEKEGNISDLTAQAATVAQLQSELASTRSLAEAAEKKANDRNEALTQEIEQLREARSDLESQLKMSKEAQANAAKEHATVLDKARQELSTYTSKNEALVVTISRLESDATKTEDENSRQLTKLKTEISDSKASLENVSREFEQAQAELESARKALQSQQEASAQLESQVKEVESQRDQLDSDLRTANQEKGSVESEVRQLQEELKETQEEASRHHSNTEKKLSARIAELESGLAAESLLYADIRKKNDDLNVRIESLTTDLNLEKEESCRLQAEKEELSLKQDRLKGDLDRQTAEAAQLSDSLATSRQDNTSLRSEVDELSNSLSARTRELAEKEREATRIESDTIVDLRKQITALESVKEQATSASKRFEQENASLTQSFNDLKRQLGKAEKSIQEAQDRESELQELNREVTENLEKAEAGNSEMATRIKEDAATALAHRELIEKLEKQLQESESDSLKRLQDRSDELQSEIDLQNRRISEQDKVYCQLETELEKSSEKRAASEAEIQNLRSKLAISEEEISSIRALLETSEKRRAESDANLKSESSLAGERASTIESLREELAATICEFQESESALLAKHCGEITTLNGDIRAAQDIQANLATELENTRAGLSEALRFARESSEREQSRLLAESHRKLAELEEELTRSIQQREDTEASCHTLEDELNERDGKIEQLIESIEDLELKIKDDEEVRHHILTDLQLTREGLSGVIHSAHIHLAQTKNSLQSQVNLNKETENRLNEAESTIEMLRAEKARQREDLEKSIGEWESKYEQLREEKLTLASEDANLSHIRQLIDEANEKKQRLESELETLTTSVSDFETKQAQLEDERKTLLTDRESLKAELNQARSELESVQNRFAETQRHEEKTSESISSAEKRIQSLKHLESKLELALKRKRQQGTLSRSDVFDETEIGLDLSGIFSEEDFYRKLIGKLDLLDDLMKRYENKWRYPKVAEQLNLLKNAFLDLLEDHSVSEFNLEPGTQLSIEERKRIKLVPLKEGATKRVNGKGSSQVIETVRPGYVYQNGTRDVIIRKAEVVVA